VLSANKKQEIAKMIDQYQSTIANFIPMLFMKISLFKFGICFLRFFCISSKSTKFSTQRTRWQNKLYLSTSSNHKIHNFQIPQSILPGTKTTINSFTCINFHIIQNKTHNYSEVSIANAITNKTFRVCIVGLLFQRHSQFGQALWRTFRDCCWHFYSPV